VAARRGASVELALYTANDRKGLLEEVLGQPLTLVERPSSG
jgi:hypothetical protein